jgi:hypothetical protein
MKRPSEKNINILVIIFIFISILISSLALANKSTNEIKNQYTFKKTSLSAPSFNSTVSSK